MASQEPKKETPQSPTKNYWTLEITPTNSNPGQKKENSDGPTGQPFGGSVAPGGLGCNTGLTGLQGGGVTFIALYHYEAFTAEDLSIKKGDKLQIINNQDEYWWQARCLTSGREGYVPSNYVTPVGSIESKEWFIDHIRLLDANRMLLAPGNPQGTFLVRKSETLLGCYSLSIRSQDSVTHYRIRNLDTGGFFINMKQRFATLDELISYYSTNDGLRFKLSNVCPNSQSPLPVGVCFILKDKLEIDRSLLTLSKKLGAGQFGEVWEGVWNSNIRVAIRTLKQGALSRKDLLTEVTKIKKLEHKNLIQLYAVCTLEEPIYIVTEYMHEGSLLDYFQKGDGCKLETRELIDICAQVASGMAHLELHRCIHGDLAAKNVLVGENVQIKVADFGLARVINEDIHEARTGAKFSARWTAPELLYNSFTIKSDIWSFGVLLMEIITLGGIPYPEMTNDQVLFEVASPRNYRMAKPPNTPNYLYQIMLCCWDSDAVSRPTFEYLKYQLEDFYAESGVTLRWGKLW